MILTRLFLFLLALSSGAFPAHAATTIISFNRPLCYAVTSSAIPGGSLPRLPYVCDGAPRGYQRGSLWIRIGANPQQPTETGLALFVHQTRFDRLTVFFTYADGKSVRQEVRRGAYGDHWRVGGQIAFEEPGRDVALSAITLRFDHLASHNLVRARLMPMAEANKQAAIAAALIGGALTLLLLGALYNLSLATAVRQPFLAWHGIWAACVLIWGLLWSQLVLVLVPQIAGTIASQICTLLACLATAAATVSAILALGRDMSPYIMRKGALALAACIAALGVPAALATSGEIDRLGSVLGVLTLADLAAIAFCILWAWRRGSPEARDFALAWSIPMAALALTELVDMRDSLFGGGAQIAVLFASGLQTAWLSVAVTRRLSRLRTERDSARAAEAKMTELANRDALTGLLNRRGFIGQAERMMAGRVPPSPPFGLLLIDVDHFKSVNDRFGHETGDAVLRRVARRLARWEGDLCIVGRLGGEEFVMGINGLPALGVAQFAERVRREIEVCAHPEVEPGQSITVSIGVASADGNESFQQLYGAADRKLYEAKVRGRNRVVFNPDMTENRFPDRVQRR